VVRGPLGIGKTTVAKRLARSLRGRYISVDAILEEFDLEEWSEGYISEASFLRTNPFVVERATPHLANGTPVVVDGNFYWESQVSDLCGRIPYPSTVFTLKGSLELCIFRDAHRKRSFGEDSARDVYAKVVSFECGIPVDATRPLPAIVEELRSRLTGRAGARPRRATPSAARARRSRG
jgi:tRNA uridine 5-carbamoylmethylation protein Kti12